jgi:hypothetical protein
MYFRFLFSYSLLSQRKETKEREFSPRLQKFLTKNPCYTSEKENLTHEKFTFYARSSDRY